MADVSITDQLKLSAAVTIPDDSAFALSKLTNLNFASVPVIGDFAKALDQCSFQEASAGATVSSPALVLNSDAATTVTVAAGENAKVFVCPAKTKFLFSQDGFSPDISIAAGECWVGLELATSVSGALSAKADGFGISLNQKDEVRFGEYILFGDGGAPLPTLQAALQKVLQEFKIGLTAASLRNQKPGTVLTIGTEGKVEVSVSYSLPVNIDALASASLPIVQLSIQPSATVKVTGGVALTGDFIVRSHRCDANTLVLGLYKKKDTTLTATFAAGAGVGVDAGGQDVLTPMLNAMIPAADLQSLQLDKEQASDLKAGLKACVNESLSVAVNAQCSSSFANEAALIYSIDLTQIPDTALASALRGDWFVLENAPGATPLRNIVKQLDERKHRVNLNLIGLLNATSIHDYIRSASVRSDGSGQIVLVDQAAAKSLSVTDTPYRAKEDKLRSALAQAFLATVTYSAALAQPSAKLALKSFTIRQSYLDYKQKASAQDIRKNILLARCLGIQVSNAWDAILQTNAMFDYAKCYFDVQYALADVMRIFYADPAKRSPRSEEDLDKIGRDTRVRLLDPGSPTATARRMALSSDSIWNDMSADGNTANFKLIQGLAKLPPPALAAVTADWVDIRWWSDAMQRIPNKLTAVLQWLDSSTSAAPLQDADFLKRQKDLQAVLSDVTAKTQSAFGDGWGMAVMCACTGGAPFIQMDIGWNNKFEHYQAGSRAVGAGGNS